MKSVLLIGLGRFGWQMAEKLQDKSKVPPCKRPFYYQKIRNPLIFSVPVP